VAERAAGQAAADRTRALEQDAERARRAAACADCGAPRPAGLCGMGADRRVAAERLRQAGVTAVAASGVDLADRGDVQALWRRPPGRRSAGRRRPRSSTTVTWVCVSPRCWWRPCARWPRRPATPTGRKPVVGSAAVARFKLSCGGCTQWNCGSGRPQSPATRQSRLPTMLPRSPRTRHRASCSRNGSLRLSTASSTFSMSSSAVGTCWHKPAATSPASCAAAAPKSAWTTGSPTRRSLATVSTSPRCGRLGAGRARPATLSTPPPAPGSAAA